MGTKPGERLLGQLEQRAEEISGQFNSQDTANTLWASCLFGLVYTSRFCCALSPRLLVFETYGTKERNQMHQLFIDCDMNEGLVQMGMPISVLVLKEKLQSCKAAFIGQPLKKSATQQQVSDTLRGMGLSVEDEFRCPKSGYSIDMRVRDMRANANSRTGAAVGWAVEFDGPSHFLACRSPVGSTLMKRRHLDLLGYTVVSLPFWEWDQLTGSDERKEYLRGKLHIS
jgi:hypothetical protein